MRFSLSFLLISVLFAFSCITPPAEEAVVDDPAQEEAALTQEDLEQTPLAMERQWMEVDSFSPSQDENITSSHRFLIQPIGDGNSLINNTGITFEATFTCTRQEGDEDVYYRTRSHFFSRKSGTKLHISQTMSGQQVNSWPGGVKIQEVKIALPFFPWELTSDRVGDVYLYLVDDEDGTCMSNIIMIPVEIKVGEE